MERADVYETPAPPTTDSDSLSRHRTNVRWPTSTASITKVIIRMPALMVNSMISMSSGDEAGVAGGVVSGMNMGQPKFLEVVGVLVEGKPGVTTVIGHEWRVAECHRNQLAPQVKGHPQCVTAAVIITVARRHGAGG
jgi:hypothetical protein